MYYGESEHYFFKLGASDSAPDAKAGALCQLSNLL